MSRYAPSLNEILQEIEQEVDGLQEKTASEKKVDEEWSKEGSLPKIISEPHRSEPIDESLKSEVAKSILKLASALKNYRSISEQPTSGQPTYTDLQKVIDDAKRG